MGMTKEEKRERLMAAFARFCQLGRLLPSQEDLRAALEDGDKQKIAEAKIILAEQAKVQAEIDAILAEDRTAKENRKGKRR